MRRFELSDVQWKRVEGLLPGRPGIAETIQRVQQCLSAVQSLGEERSLATGLQGSARSRLGMGDARRHHRSSSRSCGGRSKKVGTRSGEFGTKIHVACDGCDKEEQLRQWQQQQVEHFQQQAREIAETARELVDADAQARQEVTAIHHELQTERIEPGQQRDALESDCKEVAACPSAIRCWLRDFTVREIRSAVRPAFPNWSVPKYESSTASNGWPRATAGSRWSTPSPAIPAHASLPERPTPAVKGCRCWSSDTPLILELFRADWLLRDYLWLSAVIESDTDRRI